MSTPARARGPDGWLDDAHGALLVSRNPDHRVGAWVVSTGPVDHF
jgi:hypothetical protein